MQPFGRAFKTHSSTLMKPSSEPFEFALKDVQEVIDKLKDIAWQELKKKGDQSKSRTRTDLVLTVFGGLWKSKGEDWRCKSAYFRKAIDSKLKDYARKRNRKQEPKVDAATPVEDLQDRVAAPSPARLPMEFEAALEALAEGDGKDPALIDVFQLLHLEELSVAEAAVKLDCSPSTVRRRDHDALGFLRRRLSR